MKVGTINYSDLGTECWDPAQMGSECKRVQYCKCGARKHCKNIKKRNYNVRVAYSALGGNVCMKPKEGNDVIAYFTALRASLADLPMLIGDNVTFEPAIKIRNERFDKAH